MERVLGNKVNFSNLVTYSLSILTSCQFTNEPGLSFCRGSRVEGRGFHVEGEGTMSRVEGNIFFSNFFFLEKAPGKGNHRCNQCHESK